MAVNDTIAVFQNSIETDSSESALSSFENKISDLISNVIMFMCIYAQE